MIFPLNALSHKYFLPRKGQNHFQMFNSTKLTLYTLHLCVCVCVCV